MRTLPSGYGRGGAAPGFRRARAIARRRPCRGGPPRRGASLHGPAGARRRVGKRIRSGRAGSPRHGARQRAVGNDGRAKCRGVARGRPLHRCDPRRRGAPRARCRAASRRDRGMRDEGPLVELALGAERAEPRLAAAERVRSAEGLRKLASAAKDKDRGVTRLARQRLEAIADRAGQAAEADAILEQLQALTASPARFSPRRSRSTGAGRRSTYGERAPRALGRGPAGAAGALRSRAGRAAGAVAVRAQAARMDRCAEPPARRTRWPACAPSCRRCARRRRDSTTARRSMCWTRPDSASRAGSGSGRRSRAPKRWSWKPSSSRRARPSTTRICPNGGRRWTARSAVRR